MDFPHIRRGKRFFFFFFNKNEDEFLFCFILKIYIKETMRKIEDASTSSSVTLRTNGKMENGFKNGTIDSNCVTNSPCNSQNTGTIILEEIFYISTKRTSTYRVRLSERCLSLRKESSNGLTKTEFILVEDIIGCR